MMNTRTKADAAPAIAGHTPGPWRYEASTKTIRSVPANYWLATMDSWDGAINNEANARLIASAPALLAERDALRAALKAVLPDVERYVRDPNGEQSRNPALAQARAALAPSQAEAKEAA